MVVLLKLKFFSLILVCWIKSRQHLFAQQVRLSFAILDSAGRGIAGARVMTADGLPLVTTGKHGSCCVNAPRGAVIQVLANGFIPLRLNVSQILDGRILLRSLPAQRPLQQALPVTAYRPPLATATSPMAIRVLSMDDFKRPLPPNPVSKPRQAQGLKPSLRSSSPRAKAASQRLSTWGARPVSRGVAVAFQSEPVNWLMLDRGYHPEPRPHADVNGFSASTAQPNAKRISPRARGLQTLQSTFTISKLTTLPLQRGTNQQQYDHDANQVFLHGWFQMDATAMHSLEAGHRTLWFRRSGTRTPHLGVVASAENVLGRASAVSPTRDFALGATTVGRTGLRDKTGN